MKTNSIPQLIALALGLAGIPAMAEDWGAYSIVPVSAQATVLEAVGSGNTEGTVVSINRPAGAPNQKWIITPAEAGFFSIRPAHDTSLVLAAGNGGTKNGAAIVLEKDSGKPWQLWALTKHENGSYTLTPKHAPEQGLDDNGGKQAPGSKI
ncbi:MAG: RICIN domain-containing protein, partial [Chthoniobacteraceae bacterium]